MWTLLKFFFFVALIYIIIILFYSFVFDIDPLNKLVVINVPIK